MQKHLFLLVMIVVIISCQPTEKVTLTNYIDPFIGSDETDFVSLWRSEAGLYPGAVAPHGMVQLSPETQTSKEYLQGYFYKKDTIRKFSMTEHFSGWPNGSAGKGNFMPFITEDYQNVQPSELKSYFDHSKEDAKAGYYQVELVDHDISCEFASLIRSGITNFRFSKEGQKGIHFSSFQSFKEVGSNEFKAVLRAGRSEFIKADQSIYIHFKFNDKVELKEVKNGRRSHWFVLLNDQDKIRLQFKLGISYVSFENARENLETEIPGWSLEEVAQQADQLWEYELQRIEIEGNEVDKKTFYTALYHASLLPFNATDINRQFPGYENSEPLEDGETHYIYLTPWDAFRTLHPLVNFINPKKGRDYMQSSLRFYDTYKRVPEPSVMTSVFMSSLYADALEQGIDFDVEKAYKGLKELMIEKPYFRDKEMKAYDSLGFVPFPMSYATTATLEFSHNDWSLAKIAEQVGDKDLSQKLYRRSLNYQTQLEPKSRFMRSRNPDKSWADATI